VIVAPVGMVSAPPLLVVRGALGPASLRCSAGLAQDPVVGHLPVVRANERRARKYTDLGRRTGGRQALGTLCLTHASAAFFCAGIVFAPVGYSMRAGASQNCATRRPESRSCGRMDCIHSVGDAETNGRRLDACIEGGISILIDSQTSFDESRLRDRGLQSPQLARSSARSIFRALKTTCKTHVYHGTWSSARSGFVIALVHSARPQRSRRGRAQNGANAPTASRRVLHTGRGQGPEG